MLAAQVSSSDWTLAVSRKRAVSPFTHSCPISPSNECPPCGTMMTFAFVSRAAAERALAGGVAGSFSPVITSTGTFDFTSVLKSFGSWPNGQLLQASM